MNEILDTAVNIYCKYWRPQFEVKSGLNKRMKIRTLSTCH